MSDEYYIQNTNTRFTSVAMWVASGGVGWTRNLNRAMVYSKKEAAKRKGVSKTLLIWSKAYVDEKAERIVDPQIVGTMMHPQEAKTHNNETYNIEAQDEERPLQ